MSRETRRHCGLSARKIKDALTEYLSALEEIYPPAKGAAQVMTRQDNRLIVSIPLPMRARDRMRLFDRMAEVGTKLLLETDQYIILSGR
jgi:hypothetical protein